MRKAESRPWWICSEGPVAEPPAEDVRNSVEVTAIGAFLAGKHATRRMLAAEPVNGVRGTILFTGASAGVKEFPQSVPFAMGKFAQRGLAESMARELHPKGKMSPVSTSTAASSTRVARSQPSALVQCCAPRPFPAPFATSSTRTAAPGPTRSPSGPGWSSIFWGRFRTSKITLEYPKKWETLTQKTRLN